MQIYPLGAINEIKIAHTEEAANAMLQSGWQLLSVGCPNVRDTPVVVVLGRRIETATL